METRSVDSFRFIDTLTQQMVKSWISLEHPHGIPWTPLKKPLSECTVALVSSGGIALKNDAPFDQEHERRDPWESDPSLRIIPTSATGADVRVYHLHINPALAEEDINCLLPVTRLAELQASGEIGRAAPSHYSFMGYTTRPQRLLAETVPAMIRQMQAENVEVVVLVPA